MGHDENPKLNKWLEKWEVVHSSLKVKKIEGKPLSLKEQIKLRTLNSQLERLMAFSVTQDHVAMRKNTVKLKRLMKQAFPHGTKKPKNEK